MGVFDPPPSRVHGKTAVACLVGDVYFPQDASHTRGQG